MMNPEDVQNLISKSLSSAEVTVTDMTGTQDHFEIMVLWEGFKGKSLIQQHQIVNKSLAEALEDGRIHAIKIKTFAPKN
jgi:acid stress-induced BolA-like protein IbaG/YrbA